MSQPTQEAVNAANAAAQPNTGPATALATTTATQATGTETAGSSANGQSTETEDTGRGSKDAILADLATERDRRQAAEQQTQAVLKAVQQALGIQSATDDPKELANQLSSAQTETASAKLQLALYRSPAARTADIDGLLDSRSFQEAVKGLDPSNGPAIQQAIQQFVEQNPRFKTSGGGDTGAVVPAARDLGQGNNAAPVAKTMDDLIRGR